MTRTIDNYEQEMRDLDYWNRSGELLYETLESQWRHECHGGLALPDEVYTNRTLMLNMFSENQFNWKAYMAMPRFESATLDTLKNGFRGAVNAWIDALTHQNVNLVFVGGNNTGKTHSAFAACRFMMLHGVMRASDNLYLPQAAMLDCVDAHNVLDGWQKDQDAAANVEHFKKIPLLLIDDLGAVSTSSSSALSNIATIVTARYNNDLPMVVTSNMNPEQLTDLYGSTMVRRVFSDGSKIHGLS